jgi:hypothetical protein
MDETKLIAAILTVAFYTGRGAAMSLPQILATYEEMCALLTSYGKPKARKRGRK